MGGAAVKGLNGGNIAGSDLHNADTAGCSGLVSCGSMLDSCLLYGNVLDSDLLSGAVISSSLLGTNMACEFLSRGGVVSSGLVTCGSEPGSCLLADRTLDSVLICGMMVGSCFLGNNFSCACMPGGGVIGSGLVGCSRLPYSRLLIGDALDSDLIGGYMVRSSFL